MKLLQLRGGVIVVTLLLLVALPLHFTAHYGNQRVDYISVQELSGSEHVNRYAQDFYLTGALVNTSTEYPDSTSKSSRVWKLPYDEIAWRDGQSELIRAEGMIEDWPYLIIISQRAQDISDFKYSEPHLISDIEKSLDRTTNSNYVFANGVFGLYASEAAR